MERKASPSAVRDAAWALVAPYVTLMTAEAPQRAHRWREVLNGRRWVVRAGAAWRLMPHDLPPWYTVSQQRQRWLKAGVCAASGPDLRAVLRPAQGRAAAPSAVICDSRMRPSTPDSSTRAGYEGAKRRRGSQGHTAVETLGPLLAVHVTAANAHERPQVQEWAHQGQPVTGEAVALASVEQGYTGEQAAHDAATHHIQLAVVKRPAAKKGVVLLPKPWVVERRNAWAARGRRLAREYEQLAETLAGLHFVAFAILMRKRFVELIV
jgi:transposase